MADFNLFIPILLRNEGGWSDRSDDRGGPTNKGVTFKLFVSCAQRILGIAPTLEALKALTDEQSASIYRVVFWNEMRGDDFQSQDLANIVCDYFVNAGHPATKLLQSIINQLSLGSFVTVDGVIGPATIAALNGVNQALAYRSYKQQRIEQYRQIAAADPLEADNLHGWINRVNTFPDVAAV